ncbi:MAG: ldcA [Solimicrobium sp.]|jgi:muramoyltetrapeptide carboxypeptidase|nr:ldcA [Solimicrobium sp.]
MPTIAIIAPSGYAPNQDNVTRAIERLEKRDWTIKNLVDPNAKYQRFSAQDAIRLTQFYRAAEDPDVDVVLALRGGYGISRFLDEIDFTRLASTKKLFVGFSDFTAFQLGLLAKTDMISFAGPMINEDFGSEQIHDYAFHHFRQCLTQDNYSFEVAVEGNPSVQAQGIFWGGNLSIITHLIGSQFMPKIANGILFVEDVNENPYRVERMILQLHHAGILAQQKALILGYFTNYGATNYDNGYDFGAMLIFLRSKLSIPIITGLPFGHCPEKVTLPIGALVRVNSDAQRLSLQFGEYPHLTN